jgi:hypothetical protein
MKIFLLVVSLTAISAISVGQNIKIDEPEFSGVMVYVNDSIGTGIKLEQQVSSTKTKSNGAAFIPVVGLAAGKAKSKGVVKGCCSPVTINRKTDIQFVIKVKDNSVDPTTIINIFKLTKEKDTRIIEVGSASVIGGTKSMDIEFLQFSGKKYGTSSYLIKIDNIESGEYAITLADRRDLFNMFSIID